LTQENRSRNSLMVLLPIFGTVLFLIIYFIATCYYPGGSQIDKHSIGFSWINNYWCNLLNETAINGIQNPAKPIALIGMIILCITMTLFWFQLPRQLKLNRKLKLIIRISGAISMTLTFLLFTPINHDLVTNLASIFGLIATVGTFAGLYKKKWSGLFTFGLLNVLLVGLNNYIYYTKGLIVYLPVIQKITFGTFLLWICAISLNLFRQR
jgi:hypothetical protein